MGWGATVNQYPLS